jgi:hypothetical protein
VAPGSLQRNWYVVVEIHQSDDFLLGDLIFISATGFGTDCRQL